MSNEDSSIEENCYNLTNNTIQQLESQDDSQNKTKDLNRLITESQKEKSELIEIKIEDKKESRKRSKLEEEFVGLK